MNSKDRRVENRHKRHQEKQLLEKEYSKVIKEDDESFLPTWEKINKKREIQRSPLC